MAENLGNILVITLIILAILLSFAIGSNDETPSALAATGTIKFRNVLILGGVGIAIGTIFLSEEVASTVGAKFLGPSIDYTIYMLLSVLISAIVWLIIGSFAGIPLSSTHSMFGSIIGVVLVRLFTDNTINPAEAFNWSKMTGVFLSWIVSPLVGYIFAFIFYKIISKIFISKLKGLNQIEKSEHYFALTLIVVVFGVSIYTGANSAEALGIVYALFDSNDISLEIYWFSKILLGVFALLGLIIAGRYVIKNLASQMTDSRPSDGLILQFTTLLILIVNTVIGLPISHSHVIVFSIIGLNAAQRKEVDYKNIGKMAVYWVLTLPIAAILGGLIYFGFNSFGLI